MFKNLMRKLSRGQTALGLELTDHDIKLCEIQQFGSYGIRVNQFAARSLADGVVQDGRIQDMKQVEAAIRSMLTAERWSTKHVNLAIPSPNVMIRTIKLPDVKPRQMYKLLEHEIKHHMHIPFEDAHYDFIMLPAKEQQAIRQEQPPAEPRTTAAEASPLPPMTPASILRVEDELAEAAVQEQGAEAAPDATEERIEDDSDALDWLMDVGLDQQEQGQEQKQALEQEFVKPVEVVEADEAVEVNEVAKADEEAAEAVETIEVAEAVEAVEAVEAAEAVEAVEAVEADQPVWEQEAAPAAAQEIAQRTEEQAIEDGAPFIEHQPLQQQGESVYRVQRELHLPYKQAERMRAEAAKYEAAAAQQEVENILARMGGGVKLPLHEERAPSVGNHQPLETAAIVAGKQGEGVPSRPHSQEGWSTSYVQPEQPVPGAVQRSHEGGLGVMEIPEIATTITLHYEIPAWPPRAARTRQARVKSKGGKKASATPPQTPIAPQAPTLAQLSAPVQAPAPDAPTTIQAEAPVQGPVLAQPRPVAEADSQEQENAVKEEMLPQPARNNEPPAHSTHDAIEEGGAEVVPAMDKSIIAVPAVSVELASVQQGPSQQESSQQGTPQGEPPQHEPPQPLLQPQFLPQSAASPSEASQGQVQPPEGTPAQAVTDEPTAEQQLRDVMMVAASKATLDSYADLCERLGLRLTSIELRAFALLRLQQRFLPGFDTGAYLLLDINRSSCDVTIVENGAIKLTRDVELMFQPPVAQEGNEAPAYAEALRGDLFGDMLQVAPSVGVGWTLEGACQDLSAELGRLMNFYKYSLGNREREISAIVVTGNLDDMQRTVALLRNYMSPQQVILLESGQYEVSSRPQQWSLPFYAVAMGLGLRGKGQ